MNIKEALQGAIKYETWVRDAYRQAMDQAMSKGIKRMLEKLSHDEHLHLEALRKAYSRLTKKGKLEQFEVDLSQFLSEADASVAEIKKELESGEEKERISRTLERLLEVERETFSFYKVVSQKLPIKHKKFFDRFVQSEKLHMAMIKKSLEKYSSNVSYNPK